MKTDRNFLSPADRAILVEIARDGLEEHRIARRANAILLLDKGWSYAEVAEALLVDDSTIRDWLKAFNLETAVGRCEVHSVSEISRLGCIRLGRGGAGRGGGVR